MKESKLQKSVMEILAANGYLSFPIEYRNSRGCPDLMVFSLRHPRIAAFLELKTRTGKLSEIQINNLRLYTLWGHDVGIVRTPDEALNHVRSVFDGEENDTQETAKTTKRVLQTQNRQTLLDRGSHTARD